MTATATSNATKPPPNAKSAAAAPKNGTPTAIIPRSIDELMQLASIIFKAGPPAGHGRTESVAMAIAFGMEIGLLPIQSVSCVMVVNGKPSVYGDAGLALLQSNPLCAKLDHGVAGDGEDRHGWIVTLRRNETVERRTTFSIADARTAELW